MPSDSAAGAVEARTARETACAGGPAPRTVNACPVGTWVVRDEALAGPMQTNQGGVGTGATFMDASGTVALALGPDGAARWIVDGLSVGLSLPIPDLGGNAVVDIGGAGIVDGCRGGRATASSTGASPRTTRTSPSRWTCRGISSTTDWGAEPFEDSTYAYACAGDALRLAYAGPQSRPVASEWHLARR
jgi:hypothetical protein